MTGHIWPYCLAAFLGAIVQVWIVTTIIFTGLDVGTLGILYVVAALLAVGTALYNLPG